MFRKSLSHSNTLLSLGLTALLVSCASDANDLTQPHQPLMTLASIELTAGPSAESVKLPAPSDWTDHGEIFTAGSANQWDLYLWGGFAATVVAHEGRTLLYYQGSDGYDETEGTVTHRAVGVAVSDNGLDFTKYGQNPVLVWSPTGGIEEGAASAAAFLDASNAVHLFYGANTAISSSEVNADGRWATATDGLAFTDHGVALDHSDLSFWGAGDELFPIFSFRESTTWYVYYLPNGTAATGNLAVAWGEEPTSLQESAPVLAESENVAAWGPAGWGRISPSLYAVFVSSRDDAHVAGWHMDVFLVDPARPDQFTGPVQTYDFENMLNGTVRLDHEMATWYLYYRNADASAYGVRTAPFEMPALEPRRKGPIPTSPPLL